MILINTGQKDVLESASFISLGLGETSVTIGNGSEMLTFLLDFVSKPGSETNIGLEAINEHSLRVKLTNVNTPFSTTFLEPIRVGSFRSRELYFMLSVHKIGSSGDFFQVTFTSYLGEEVNDG